MNIITPRPRLHLILLPFIACIFFLRAATNAPAQELTLLTNAVVDSEGVFLSQVDTSTNPLPYLRLADAPQFGQAIVLTRAQIAELLQKSSTEPATAPS